MKNKARPKESIFKKKGFYIALYSALGVMVVLAAVISMNSFDMFSQNDPSPAEQSVDMNQFSPVDQSGVSNYAKSRDLDQIEAERNDVQVRLGDPRTTTKPQASTAPSTNPTKSNADKPITQSPEIPKAKEPQKQTSELPSESQVGNEPESSVEVQNNQESNGNEYASENETSAEELGEPVFNVYTEENRMEWPITGDIVMNYSMDRTTYDKTLDQYRTNDNICIAAPAGTPVKASAEGVVIQIENTRTKGNTVVIDNGNGWTTTYCQLQDGVLVSTGDIVKAGQVLGGVGNPSIYGVLLGNHLNFKVTKDDRNVDPLSVLAQ